MFFNVSVNASISDGLSNDEGFIYRNSIGIDSFDNVYYIENYKYFKANPKHAESNTTDNGAGTCTTVAMQLLMGYHNYYTDRRLIPEFDENNEIFLSPDYARISSNPIEVDLVYGETIYTIMDEEDLIGDNFVKLEILEPSSISVIYDYTGTQSEIIYFVLFKEAQILGENRYEVQLVFPEMMTAAQESLEWNSSITSGVYYIGYFNKYSSTSTISIAITR